MQTEEGIKWFLEASEEEREEFERFRARLRGGQPERPSLRLYRMGEAAKETGLSRQTIWRAIREQRIRACEIRKGSFRIPEAELRRFVGAE